ncbi:DNA-binding response regulator, OmpR family, contains REC and winged-helix (wHTH) domain [Sporobacter termitidis DSM 10068]|uniref:Stage 0 sporulation protein A homolog n=1 Tax=Sporobacter termitidis DSM 10068 TaxID=1123282 RepID=A0A1M5YUG7_9FIRM|nr:response regulator transcription factor [Sporobacter termitidis]SHI15223.1 DNA-binding response regulator, OmpR family, contains REC and winged-helix (wHTH) domain [Sporobacter termitidis DSM 10068]
MRILVIEDEKRLADTLADIISTGSDIADVSYDGESGLDNALSGIYDAIVLDVMLPVIDGFEVLRRLRAGKVSTPVLMLTARAELEDRVAGLDLGADYYLTKPFENAEFLACLRTIMRRRGDIMPDVVTYGDLTLNPSGCELRCRDRSVRLSFKELAIMRLFFLNREQILSKETILNKVWGYDSEADDNNVEAYISFLRKKLLFLGSGVSIAVVRRVGYYLEVSGT